MKFFFRTTTRIGSDCPAVVNLLGEASVLFGQTLASLFTQRLRFRELVRLMHFFGVKSQFVVLTTGIFIGAVYAAQIQFQFARLGEAAEKLNNTLATACDAMSNAREASASATSALDKVNQRILDEKTVADFKKVIAVVSRTVANLQSSAEDLKKGDGVLGRLATDKQLADDLAAFVANPRQRGILFYADVASREQAREERTPQTQPPRPVAPAQGTRTPQRSTGSRWEKFL